MEVGMPNLKDRAPKKDKEVGYKRGYTHGAQAVLDAVEPHISKSQLTKLRQWISELREWQGSGSAVADPPILLEL
jgi:hypothetical protein